MSVVRFPARKPKWLYFVAGRLMVTRDHSVHALHAQARRIGVGPARYYGGSVPYYRLAGAEIMRAVQAFGPMPTSLELLEVAEYLCDRRRSDKSSTLSQ